MKEPDKMIELIAVARTFNVRPSSLLYGLSTYEAYCFDTACLVYVGKLSDGEDFNEKVEEEDASKWL